MKETFASWIAFIVVNLVVAKDWRTHGTGTRLSRDTIIIKSYRNLIRKSKLGSKFVPAHSCQEVFEKDPDAKSGVFWLTMGKEQLKAQVYCQKKEKHEKDDEEELPENLNAGKPEVTPFDWEELHRESWPRPIDPPTKEEMNRKVQKAWKEYKESRKQSGKPKGNSTTSDSSTRSNITTGGPELLKNIKPEVHFTVDQVTVTQSKKSETYGNSSSNGTTGESQMQNESGEKVPDNIRAEDANTTLMFQINNKSQEYDLHGKEQFKNIVFNQSNLFAGQNKNKQQFGTNVAYIKFGNGGHARNIKSRPRTTSNDEGRTSPPEKHLSEESKTSSSPDYLDTVVAESEKLKEAGLNKTENNGTRADQAILGLQQAIDSEDDASEVNIENPDDISPGNIWPPRVTLMIGKAFEDYKAQKTYADSHGGANSIFSQLKGENESKGASQSMEGDTFSGSGLQDEITSEQVTKKLNSIPYAKYLD